MQLTRQTDLALRLLIYAAMNQNREDPVVMVEVSNFYRVSHEHLRKVVHRLGQFGFLTTNQGRHGGLRLAHPAERINVADVVEAMERDLSIVDCKALDCVLQGPCSLKHALLSARSAFLAVLRQYSLASLLSDRATMTRIGKIVRLRAV